MLELILVRHGETESNIKGTYCGWTDAELTAEGEAQARLAAGKLEGTMLDAIYSSPLKRAFCTARTINSGFGLEIICTDSLKEHNFGKWEDLTHAEICGNYPEESIAWEKDWVNYRIEGGESAQQAYQRVAGFVDDLVSRHKNGRILLVTHLGCIKYIIVHLLHMQIDGIWRFHAGNGSITRLVVNDEGFAHLAALNL